MQFFIENIYLVSACILGAFALLVFLLVLRKDRLPYYKRDALLTPSELNFYRALHPLLDINIGVAFKVRMNDIMTCSDKDWSRGYGPKISAKHLDFTLYDKTTTEILGCIELDDRSHQRRDRKRRDKFVNTAFETCDVPLMRIQAQKGYNTKELKNLLVELLA